jgi:hypothetical protein
LDNRIIFALAAIAALLVVTAIWWLWWRLPKQQADRLALKIRDAKARVDVEDNFRKTVGQALGGAAVLLGAGLAYLQFSQQQRAAHDLLSSNHDLLISNQVSKGFEQLGSKEIVVRLGGIYALEGVMNTSDQYHQPVLEALSAFVREGAKPPQPLVNNECRERAKPPTDIQAALTVIGRRSAGQGAVNLSGAVIPGANLFGTDLSAYVLSDANLTGANLSQAFLGNADLIDANLSCAKLFRANLTGSYLAGDNLSQAFLGVADLSHANLSRANLTGAVLTGANLTGAVLTGANLTDATLDGQQQLDEACGSEAVLPTGLTLKPCR